MGKTVQAHHRWHVTSRVFAAAVPGFLLANTSATLLSFVLPGDTVFSLGWAVLLSFVIYCIVIMWVFSVERLRTVWLGLTAALVATGAAAWGAYLLGAGS